MRPAAQAFDTLGREGNRPAPDKLGHGRSLASGHIPRTLGA
jgi:hypothetical protein